MGARVSFSGGKPKVIDGPWIETKEVLGGYGMIRVASKHPAAHLGEHVGWGIEARPIEGFEQP